MSASLYIIILLFRGIIGQNFIEIEIETNNGKTKILGTNQTDWQDGHFSAFRGIPYAEPPIGELRFKDPQELKQLPKFIDARYDGHDCPSIFATNASENCLILNIYTKNLKPRKSLPVIVFIHPGGLYLGSSLSNFIGPEYLLTKNIVLVTFNYRLATLGFLGLGTKDMPGNAGFKDQVYALRWIHKYIKHFGGDEMDITLIGYSAGGLSVSLHLTSPMTSGLFHKAIVMSGILPPQTKMPQRSQIQLALRQIMQLNCTFTASSTERMNIRINTTTSSTSTKFNTIDDANSIDTIEQILGCLNGFDGFEIAATLRSLFAFGKDNPLYLWLPIAERNFGQERFQTENFYGLMRKGNFKRVPLLIGFTDGEFCTEAAELLNSNEWKKILFESFHIVAPYIFMYENQENKDNLTKAIKEHYLGKETNEILWNVENLCDAISDALIRFGAHKLAVLASKYVNVYAYKFVYKGEYTNFLYAREKGRVEHLDDLMYLFRMSPHRFQKNEKDAEVIEMYVNFIMDFVENGKLSNSLTFPHGYTLINETLMQQNGSNFHEAEFWEQLFP